MKFQTLSSEYLFSDQWFKVRRDAYQTPSGKIVSPYYVYEFPDWATALPVTEEGKIIMIKQYRHALGEVCLELPGGCVDDTDSNLEQAIARELREETGYSFSSYEYLGKTSANPSTNNNMMHLFLATGGKQVSAQQLDSNEEIDLEFFTMAELKQLLRNNQVIQSMHVTCILYGLERLNALSY